MSFADRVRPWHRRNAYALLVFLSAHILTHLTAVFGPDTHAFVIDVMRLVYRATFIEPILIGLFIVQVGIGIVLVWPRIRQSDKSVWSWIQIVSGLYLAVFILNHIFLGVLRGRTFAGVDTGFHFVASTLITAPIRYAFIPYYFLAILAIFAHVAASLYWRGKSKAITHGLVLLGAIVAAIVVSAYSGALYDIRLPDAYTNYLEKAF